MELPPIPGGLRPDSLIVFPDTIPRISTFDGEWKTEEKETTDDEVDEHATKNDASFTDLALGEMLESEEKLLVGKDSLAWVAWQLRKNLLIATRKKGLKKFKDAFFGTHVIGWFLHAGFCQDTDEGAQLANDLLQRGYLKFCDRSLRGKPFLHEKSVVYQFTSLALVVTARVTLKDLLHTNTALSGYMKKYAEGKKVGGKWKVRYFCLSIATGALMYFYSPECVFPLSYVPLQQILFCTLTGKKGRTLTIVCWDRVLKLKAENVKEATIWQQAIEDALEPVIPAYRAPPSPKTPPEHKEEWLQADSQAALSPELFKIEQEFFKLLTPSASYYAKNPGFLRKLSGEFPSIGEVMEIIVDILLNPVVPPNIAVPDPSALLCCVSKSATYLHDSKPRMNALKVLPDLFAPVRSTVNTSPTTHHRRTGSGGIVEKRNSLTGRRNSQVGGRGHARVFSAVFPGDLSTTTERMDIIRDLITGQLAKGRSPTPAQRASLSLPPSLALPEKEKPKSLEVSPHLAAFVKPRLPASGSMRSRFGSAVENKADSLSRARNSSAFGSFTKVKDKASTWLDVDDGSNSSLGGNVVLSPAPFVETEWDPDDAKAGRAHVLGNIMAPHRDFTEFIGESQVLSSKNGIPMAWVYFQRFYHSNMPEIVQMGQEDHWKRNFSFDCDACVIASEKFAQFLSQRVGGKAFRLGNGNSILAVVVTEAQRFCIDLMEPQTKRYNVLGRTVVNPGAWVALLRCLQFSNFDVRRHTLKDIYSCVISNADNARSLLAIGDWPRLLLSLLSDLPVETISGGTTDGIDPSVQNVLLCMERIWLFVTSIISELLRITFFEALGPGDDARMSTFRERGAWMDFRTVFQKCMSIALVMSASEAPKNRLIVPRHIISSLLLAIRKRVVNLHYHLEGPHWGRLSFLGNFISNFTFSYVSIMQPLLDLPGLPNECRNSIQLAAKANLVAFGCLSSARPLKPRSPFGSPTLAPKELSRNSLSRSPSRSPHAPLRLGEVGTLQKRNSVSSFHSQSSHSASPTRRDRSGDRTLSRTRTENFIAISHHGNEMSTATNEFAFRLFQREPGLNQFYHSSYDIHPFSELPQDRNLLRIFMQLLGEVGVFTDIGRKAVTKPEKKKQIHDFVSSTQDQAAYVRSTVEVNLPGSRQLNEGELEMFRDLQSQLCWMSDVYVFLGMMSSRVLCLSHQERLAMVQAVQTTKDRDEVFRNRALAEKITVKRGEDPRFSLNAQHSWPLSEDSSVTEALLCDRDVRVPVSSWPRSFQFMMDSGDSKVGTPFAGEKGLEVLNQAVAEKIGRMEHSVEGRNSRSRTRVSRSSKSEANPESGGDISLPL